LRCGVGEAGVREIGIAEFARLDVPLALEVVAQDWLAVVVLRRPRRVVLDEHVVESLGPGLVADADNGAIRVKQQGRVQPEEPRLKIVSVLACDDRLRHGLSSLENSGP
jgi:hypothetical protein